VETVAADDYRASARSVEVYGNTLSAATVGRILQREGERLHTELCGPDASLAAAQQALPNPPPFLIVSGDGSRYRTNEADHRKAKPLPDQTAPGDEESELTREERDRGWRENKVGVVIRAEHGKTLPDGSYQPPRELVKTYVATTQAIESFGRDLRTELDRRGGRQCPEIVCVIDHGHGMPAMVAREIPEASLVTDFFHVTERLSACARSLKGEGPANERQRRRYWHGLKDRLWRGRLDELLKVLSHEAELRAPRPQQLPDLEQNQAAHTLWTHIFYIEKHRRTMDYPAYRRKGWPLGSGVAESACGQFGDRVKHNRMRWTRRNGDAEHQVKAAIFSQDGRWAARWPPPIPVLELPLAS
jgi:hypothetical protein